jgi:uncharacterized membrane protein YjjB (DUF3815 family)
VQDIAEAVLAGRLPPRDGIAALDALQRESPRWGLAITALAFGVAGASSACLLGGGSAEVIVAGALAMLTGWLGASNLLPAPLRRFHEPVAAFIVSLAVSALATRFALSTYLATLGGLIVMPGLTLSMAMTELNAQHLVSGTARLTGAIMRFLVLIFGVALGSRVAELAFGAAPRVLASPLPAWSEWLALLAAPFAFTVVMRASPAGAPAIFGVCVATVIGSRVGSSLLGPELGVFAGSLVAGLASNLLARVRRAPSLVTQSPALLLLVPGSIGFPQPDVAARPRGRERYRGGVSDGDHVRGARGRTSDCGHRRAAPETADGQPTRVTITHKKLARAPFSR